ncbi:MAG: diaminopimelate decarboxylase, partial [Acidobacteriota bacterium]|nr:diaminopimelate decarboxylase [Acidobacteriota bacterium]
EQELRLAAREYSRAFAARRPGTSIYFASKALSCSAVIAVMAAEGLGCDVSSAGELAIALAGGMPGERILMHGNAKRDLDLLAALGAGVGLIVIDSLDELDRLTRLLDARRPRRPQHVLLRVNPGVTAPTHAAMVTGDEGSKFGLGIDALRSAAARIDACEWLQLDGLHVHIGSQITELEPFTRSVEALGAAGFDVGVVIDLGGGLGVRYLPDDPAVPSAEDYATAMTAAAQRALPPAARLIFEPGRALVARAMVTVYRVVSVKRSARTFVSVDGGMADNLEPMMYGTRFAPFVLDSDRPVERCDVVGPHCETGDRLVEGWPLAGPRVDDLLVVPMTGAYCYALANNYNGAVRPPVVMCSDGRARLVQRRETIEDLLARNTDVQLPLTEPAGGRD